MKLRHVVLAGSVAANLALVPVMANAQLQEVYVQTLAHWRSKVVAPPAVFLGDSQTWGGGTFGIPFAINLGVSGAITEQVAATLPRAQAYHPARIYVSVGTNDAFRGEPPKGIEALARDPRTIFVLAPPTRWAIINDRLAVIATTIRRAAPGRVIEMQGISDGGLLKPELTYDGVHLTPSAYRYWREAIQRR